MNKVVIAVFVLVGLGSVAMMFAQSSGSKLGPAQAAELQRLRNLGKAFYEDPATQTQAVDEFRKALQLNPGSAREHLNYGLSLLRVGEAEEGIAEIETAREIDPSIPHTYFNLGIEFKRLGEADRAIQEFTQMLKLVPDEPKSYYNLGVLYRLKKDTDKAIAAFERASELDPSLAAPNFQLSNVLRRLDPERAKRKLDRFHELKDLQAGAAGGENMNWSFYSELYDPLPYVHWGNALYQQGKLPEAIAKYQKAIELDPKNALAHHNWGLALAKLGRHAEAEVRSSKARELGFRE